ncbi:multidrug efflux system outer membrane protein [Bradyrhizobium sp. AZCC 1588]|uniref:efflux transporter outer membrane subunit n=1 Tax=unclassified Bradyrhizobium TaxID=2631580 RepID=UPI002FF114AB
MVSDNRFQVNAEPADGTRTNCGPARKACPASRASSFIFAAFIVLSLAGCAVGPDYTTSQVGVPARWNGKLPGSVASSQPGRWWRSLRDPVLNTLIENAVAGNLNVATAMLRVREARANYRQVSAGLLPSITATSLARRTQIGGVPLGGAIGAETGILPSGSYGGAGGINNLFQAGLDASWELDLFGADRRNAEAAWYGVDAAEDQLDAVLLTLIGDVALNYVNFRGHEARILLAQRTARAQRETAALTRTKLEAGAASAVDLSNAEGIASSTEANIPTIEILRANAVHRIGILIGREPAAVVNLLGKAAPIPSPRLPIAAGIPANVLLSRPDVRLAERLLAQATARIGRAEAARYPSVRLAGNIATSGTEIGDLAKASSIGWSFGPTVSVPVFNAGALVAAVDAAGARRDQQFLVYQSAVLTALEDVENAIVAFAKDQARIRKLTASVSSYREAANLSRSLYQTGSASFLNVLDAQRSLYGAEEALLQTRMAFAADYIALGKALGGGWDGGIDVSRPEIMDANTGPHMPSPWSASSRPNRQ